MTNESWKEKVVEPTPPATAGWVPPTPAELAPLFPELEIVALLGRGGMGPCTRSNNDGWNAGRH